MKLNMNAGQLAVAVRAIAGKYAVLVTEGDSHLPAVDHETLTVTVFAQKPKKTKPKADDPAAPDAAAEIAEVQA
jgi:hypothetical protein